MHSSLAVVSRGGTIERPGLIARNVGGRLEPTKLIKRGQARGDSLPILALSIAMPAQMQSEMRNARPEIRKNGYASYQENRQMVSGGLRLRASHFFREHARRGSHRLYV